MKNYFKTFAIALFLLVMIGCKKDFVSNSIVDYGVKTDFKDADGFKGRQQIITLKTGNRTYSYSRALLWRPYSLINHKDNNETYPLIFNLYGQAQCGTNLNKMLDGFTMSEFIAKGFNATAVNPKDGKKYAFIVCSPQCPTSWGWSAPQVYHMIEELKNRYPIDETRIYLTGFSAGGWGLWSCVTDNKKLAKQLAAIVPISAASANHPDELTNVDEYGIACLDICGTLDAFYLNNVRYVNIINSNNPIIPAKLNSLLDIGHIAWKYAYDSSWRGNDGLNIYEWMLQYKR